VDFRQLRYFVTVAEEGNFSRAAKRLHVSQPPLSMQVKALEEELEVRLFTRGNRGVALTPAGDAFFKEARGLLARLEQARRHARQAAGDDVGTLAVGFVSIATYGILPPALKAFRAAYPRVEVQLHELTTDAQVRELRAARLDMGIGLAPVDEPDLEFERVTREALILAAPSGSAAARGTGPVKLADLAREEFIVAPRDIAPGLYDLMLSHCRAAGFAPRITQRARQMQTIIALVSCGMGVALVPASVRNLARSGVQYRPLRGKPAQVELGTLRLRNTSAPFHAHFQRALQVAARDSKR
jgi:DNA-binding transcriptional LysR family regulator